MALSALINGLYETNMVVIVRKVYSAAASPRVGVLIPNIKNDYEVSTYRYIHYNLFIILLFPFIVDPTHI